jgi:F-type H+-transporting ATPase subunit b
LRAHANKLLGVSLFVATAAAITGVPSPASAADLNLLPRWSFVGLNLVAFGLLIYPVNRLMIAPLLRLIDEREKRTAGAVEEAGRLDAEVGLLGGQLEAQVSEARARAQSRRAAILAEAESQERTLLQAASADATKTIQTVRAAIDADLVAARAALQSDARTLAGEAAARLLGRPL